jgi:hypothetical protein
MAFTQAELMSIELASFDFERNRGVFWGKTLETRHEAPKKETPDELLARSLEVIKILRDENHLLKQELERKRRR